MEQKKLKILKKHCLTDLIQRRNFYKNNGNNNIKYTESKVIGILLADNNNYPMSDILDTLNDVSGEHIDFLYWIL